jgi:hypothetical protein
MIASVPSPSAAFLRSVLLRSISMGYPLITQANIEIDHHDIGPVRANAAPSAAV